MMTLAVTPTMLALAASLQIGTTLEPAGKWSVDYGDRQCVASRSFGEAGAPVVFALRPHLGSTEEQIVLLLPSSADRKVRRGRGAVILQPSGRRFPMSFASGPVSQGRRGLNIDIDNASIRDQMTSITTLAIEGTGSDVALQVKGFVSVSRALKACEDDLLRSWGADPAAMIKPASPAAVPTWFSAHSYPPAALRAGETGQVIAMVTVDPRGLPVACRTAVSSGSAALDEGTCAILRREARYPRAEMAASGNRYSVTSVR